MDQQMRAWRSADILVLTAPRKLKKPEFVRELEDAARKAIRAGEKKLVIDMDNARVLPDFAFASLITIHTMAANDDAMVVIANAKRLRNLFQLFGLDQVLNVCDSLAEALIRLGH